MRTNKNPVEMIHDRYYNDAAGFCTRFTDTFKDPVDHVRYKLYQKQVEFMNLLKPTEKVVVAYKCRQCLTGDSMVYTKNGPKRIKDLLDSEFRGQVYTIDSNGNNILDDVVDIWGTGKKLVFEVKLASGERIRATKDHKINVAGDWKKIEDVKLGDLVSTYEGDFGTNVVSQSEIIVMGYYITDGSYSNNTPKFTNINFEYLKEFNEAVRNVFVVNTNWLPKGNGFDINVIGVDGWGSNKPNPFAQYLTNFGLRGINAAERVLPEIFLNMGRQSTALLLNRIFAGDGWYSSCGKNKMNEIGIGSPSLEFLHQIAFLLSKFGIHANILETVSGKKQKTKFYKLKFSKIEYTKKFINEIGIFGKTPRSSTEGVYSIKKENNRVVSIREIGEEETYDLTTKTHHSYIANGILVHNSGFSTCIKGKSVQKAYFKKAPQILVASAGINQSAKILRDIKKGFSSMPEFMQPSYVKETETLLILSNGVEIYSLPFNPESCRGFTGDVFLDEFGVKNRKDSNEIWEALAPTITKGYNITAVSTPKGKDNMFYDLCNPKFDEAGNKLPPYANKIIKINWSDVPYIANQIEEIRGAYHPKQFLQEYECMFLDNAEHVLFTYDFMTSHVVDQRDLLSVLNIGYVENLDGEIVPDEKKQKHLLSKYPGGIYCGWDIALTDDGSIVGAFGITADDVWELFAYKKFERGTELSEQIKFVNRFCQYICAKKITIDSTGAFGNTAMSLLRKTPIGNIVGEFKFNPQSKAQEYSYLYSKMEVEGFRIPNIPECIKEFTNLGLNPITGRIAAQGGRTNHDDWPSMFICAYSGRKQSLVAPSFTIIVPRR